MERIEGINWILFLNFRTDFANSGLIFRSAKKWGKKLFASVDIDFSKIFSLIKCVIRENLITTTFNIHSRVHSKRYFQSECHYISEENHFVWIFRKIDINCSNYETKEVNRKLFSHFEWIEIFDRILEISFLVKTSHSLLNGRDNRPDSDRRPFQCFDRKSF